MLPWQALYDPLFPKGRDRSYFRSLYLPTLDEQMINEIVSGLAGCVSLPLWVKGGGSTMSATCPLNGRTRKYGLCLHNIAADQ
jgi:hypothetical protein